MSNTLVAPTALGRKGDRVLTVSWNDGAVSEYDVRRLRLSCPCAACVNEWSGAKMLDPKSVPQDVRPAKLFSVGRYAMGIQWSDGHATGIYSYDYLRRLDEGGKAAEAAVAH
jgi:ATP-binding protein involved in chromosome partitioning